MSKTRPAKVDNALSPRVYAIRDDTLLTTSSPSGGATYCYEVDCEDGVNKLCSEQNGIETA